MSRYKQLIENTDSNTELSFRGKHGDFKSVGEVKDTHLGPKYLVVAYIERGADKVILTAYFTSDLQRVKGDIIWKRA